jgi:hypothetical protein
LSCSTISKYGCRLLLLPLLLLQTQLLLQGPAVHAVEHGLKS